MEHSNEQLFVENPEKSRVQEDLIVSAEKCGDFFERIERVDILPSKEKEWSLEGLKQDLESVFCEYGKIALEKNNGKIYTTLSGGLDSTLSLAFLRKNFPKNEIITFSMGGSVNHPDILHARLAAEKFGSSHNEFIPEASEIQEALEEYKVKFQSDLKEAVKTGDADVYLLYKYISKFHPNVLLAHDGIDELMGGYWNHRKDVAKAEKEKIFVDYWKELVPNHLEPLIKTADNFGINFLFPYLDQGIIESIACIPLEDRTSVEISKKPLREIAKELGIPKEILERPKRGQVGMLDRK